MEDFPVWEVCTVYVLRVPVQILAQVFFGYRSWSLLGKRRLLREIWTVLILFELVLGELTLFYSYSRWSLEDPRPWPVGREYNGNLVLTNLRSRDRAVGQEANSSKTTKTLFAYTLFSLDASFHFAL